MLAPCDELARASWSASLNPRLKLMAFTLPARSMAAHALRATPRAAARLGGSLPPLYFFKMAEILPFFFFGGFFFWEGGKGLTAEEAGGPIVGRLQVERAA